MRDTVRQVIVAVLVAAILFLGSAVKDLVFIIHDLRGDVDKLHSEVSDNRVYMQELAEKLPPN